MFRSVLVLSPSDTLAIALKFALSEADDLRVVWKPITRRRVSLEFLGNTGGITVLDLSEVGIMTDAVVKVLRGEHRNLSVILIMPDAQMSLRAGIEVGGNIYHVFFGMPALSDLGEFVFSAIEKQNRRELSEAV